MKEERIINPCYPYNYSRMCYALRRLGEKYKGLIGFVGKAHSTQGRSIPVITLGFGEKKILATGAIHGREYVSTGYLLLCMEEYARAFCKREKFQGFDVRKILSENTIFFVPMVNPDSVEIALGRAKPCAVSEDFSACLYKNNANNVNLNANFPFKWQAVPPARQGGNTPASEVETRFLMKLCKEQNFDTMLSFHSRGDCLYWRDEGNKAVEGDSELARRLHKKCGFSLCKPTKDVRDYSGGFENWFRCKFRKVAICVELVKDENVPFSICCRDFYSLVRWEQTACSLLLCAI